MRKKFVFVFTAVCVFALFATTAFAGDTGSVGDDVAGNRAPTVPSDANTWPTAGKNCDTIDPVLTQNRDVVSYKCLGDPDPLSSTMGLGNLTSFQVATSGLTNKMTIKWTTQGPIPAVNSEDVFAGVNGFSFGLWFQNAAQQNKRQIVGDTVDCLRYGHMGPYLTGNGEWLNVFYNIFFNVDTAKWEQEMGFGHLDPVGNNNWAFIADPDGVPYTKCDGPNGTRGSTEFTDFPGTGMTAVVSGGTVTLTVPYVFGWVDNQGVRHSYRLAAPGQTLTGVTATASNTVDAATVGPFYLPPGCELGANGAEDCVVNQSQQGVSNQFLLDWAPRWGSFDLGLLPSQGDHLPGPTCPSFEALEYMPGGGKNGPGGTYVDPGKAANGADRDTQVNPLYGLTHYDASKEAGNTAGIQAQDHHGATTCAIFIPTAAHYTGNGATVSTS